MVGGEASVSRPAEQPMATIDTVTALEVLDSRGRPTVSAEVGLSDGTRATASVPSGASTGRHEALELRDRADERYGGLGVRRAVSNIKDLIAPAIHGLRPDQAEIDATLIALDATDDKSRLGANALLAVSLATARAAASSTNAPLWAHLAGNRTPTLPLPMVNIISGGLHARRQIDFQDFLAIPMSARTYSEALEICVSVYNGTAQVLASAGHSTLKADEGGFGPAVGSHREALELLQSGVEAAGLIPGTDVAYALDVAATHFQDPATGTYTLSSEDRECDAAALTELIAELAQAFPIVSVEDPLGEDDWAGWVGLTARLGPHMQVLGDDLFTTNLARLNRGIAEGAANAVLVKMNQIGTLTETLAVADRARAAGYRAVISARSGETEDPALADLAVATGAGQIKVGSVAQSDRLSKYNRLLTIERELGGDAAPYAGAAALQLSPRPCPAGHGQIDALSGSLRSGDEL
jgi:enolase